MATRVQRRYIDADVEDAIRAKLELGRSPIQVEKELGADERIGSRLPTIRTIQRIARERIPDTSGPWEIGNSSSEDGPGIIAALREVIVYSNGERLHLTRDEAESIIRIATIAPDIPPLAHFLLTKGQERDVQVFLAMSPWSDQGPFQYYRTVVSGGLRIPIFPPMPTLVDGRGNFWERVASMWYEFPAVAAALPKQPPTTKEKTDATQA